MDEKGYIYATLKSNIKEEVPVIGFISHYDTSPDCSGADIKPRIVENYDGGDIILRGEEQEASGERMVLSPEKFPELLLHKGEDLIVTDGTTLLGADDKAGIAEIVQAMVYLREHKEIKHGKIRVGFTPDEEIGQGADHFDVKAFGEGGAHKAAEIVVALLVAAEENEVGIVAVQRLLLLVQGAGCHIDLAADNRLDAGRFTGFVKSHRTVHDTVIRHREGRHAQLLCAKVHARDELRAQLFRRQIGWRAAPTQMRTRRVFGQHLGRIVRALHHDGEQKVVDRHRLSRTDVHLARLHRRRERARHGAVVQAVETCLYVLQDKQERHQLRD